jgi:hypothetical protein
MKRKIVNKYFRYKPKRYQGWVSDDNYLKNFSVVRRWAIMHYELKSFSELELMFFLYSEKLFTRKVIREQTNFMSWDSQLLNRLIDGGFIYTWRKGGWGNSEIFDLTHKGKKMINSIYKKLNGIEPIPTSERRNKAFRKNAPFHQKTLAKAIINFNEEYKQRPSLE